MSHPPPLLPGETSADLPANSNHTSKLNSPEAVWQQWEEAALGWLSSFPGLRDPSGKEMDLWIDSNISVIPKDLRALPRRVLHQRIISLRLTVLDPSQMSGSSQMEFPYRFQRTDQWLPVYTWLESLVTDTIVNSKEITDWLSSNTDFRDRLLARHSRYHLMHYIQKLHLKLLKKKGKLPKGMLLSAARASVKSTNGSVTSRDGKASYESLKDDGIFQSRRNDAYLRYELLTDLQKQLTSFLSKHNENNYSIKDCKQTLHNLKQDHASNHSSDLVIRNEGKRIFSNAASSSLDVALNSTCTPALDANMELSRNSMPCTATNTNRDAINSNPKSAADSNIVEKRKRDPIIATPAWSYSEALPAVTQTNSSSYSQSGEARQDLSSFSSSRNQNITMCLLGREQGNTWPLYHSFNGYAGRNQRRWIPLLEGWRSLECQFEGLAVSLKRRNYSNWVPTWCAYMSSVAIAQPYGRQGLQKVLDVRFHPDGLPQLVCSSNEVPNELLLYNLLTGRPIQLTGHNTQIQAVEFAVRGASIVSCGSNLLKVWDCTTGSCLFTLGSSANDQAIVGHTQKINAMTVNDWQSCLVVTGGGSGDGKLLLWNALRGELASDLNLKLRVDNHDLPSIDAMEFCNESLLACGSDFECGGSAVVQLWDIESAQSFQCFTANNSYITSLKVNPQCSTIITGSVDGTVGLFDIRTCNAVNYLSVGPSYEVTSVSFSSCGTYFSASSTSNYTLVWDTRLIPTFVQDMSLRNCFQTRDLHLLKPLHCLSHGKQMPTSENAGQLPGHVDVGDQGVNDARWLRNEPVLITASGDGSIAMWDVNLGKPCIRHLVSHTRCVNSVAVAPNDDYFCSGGDDQKVVLYHNTRGSARKWRLSHPLAKKS